MKRAKKKKAESPVATIEKLRKKIAKLERELKPLKLSEEKFRRLSEATFEAVIIHNNGTILQVNDACCKKFGYNEKELIGTSVLSLATPDTREFVRQSVINRNEAPYEASGLKKDGTIFFAEVHAKEIPVKGKGSNLRVGAVRDISRRKMIESVLKESEQNLSLILNNIDELVYYVELSDDNNHKVKYIGNQIEDLMGITKKEYMRDPSRLLNECHPDDIPLIIKTYEKIKKQKRSHSFVYRFMHRKKKSYVWIEERIIPQTDESGRHSANFGVMRDVTDIKEHEAQIEQSRENYRNLIESSPDGIFIHDERGDVVYANPNMLGLMGVGSLDDLPNRNVMNYLPEEFHEVVKSRREKLFGGESVPFNDTRILRPDGTSMEIESKPIMVTFDGKPATLVVCHNVTVQRMLEREKLRAQLAEEASEKILQSLKEKEVLLKEVHHRVKNNLQVISSILNLQSSYVKDENTLGILKESQNRIKSMAFIHESLYQNKDLTSINFSEYIMNLAQNLIHSFSIYDGQIELQLELDEIQLNLDIAIPTGLILNELVSNSLKYAFPGKRKGTVIIRLNTDGSLIRLGIEDDGIGLPPGIDFRNTESLGLQLVTTLVEQMEGSIHLDNAKGSRFLITFNSVKK